MGARHSRFAVPGSADSRLYLANLMDMSAQLRVVLDHAVSPADRDVVDASRSLLRGLVLTAPAGCEVATITPAQADPTNLPGIVHEQRLKLARRELALAWQLGVASGAGKGMVHAASLMAPLVRHDRVHDNDQTVVTLWDLNAWTAPHRLTKTEVGWQRAMLRRAVKHADAVVVPSHATAVRVKEFAALGDRIRVIAGAAPEGFAVPTDAELYRADELIPDEYVVIVGENPVEAFRAAARAGLHAVVLDATDGDEPRIVDVAASAGLPERHVHVRGRLKRETRASVIAGAMVVVSTDTHIAWPWRVVEAMTLGVPVVAVESGVHRDVIADGGVVVEADGLVDAITGVLGDGARRAGVLAGDRGRAFSWTSSAERIWALHAEL